MRSQLTRGVFRQLLSHEGLTFHCPTKASLIQRHRHQASPSLIRHAPRRTLFGFSQKPPRVPKDPDLVPGFSKIVDLGVMHNINARPPPAPELVTAWRAFIDYKLTRKEPINRLQARYLQRTFQHLQKIRGEVEEDGRLTAQDLMKGRTAFLIMPNDKKDLHNAMAKEFYEALISIAEGEAVRKGAMKHFIKGLTMTGGSLEARKLLMEHYNEWEAEEEGEEPEKKNWAIHRLWNWILEGFAREDNEEELLRSFQMAEQRGIFYTTEIKRTMAMFFASKDDVEATKEWFTKPTPHQSRPPLASTMSAILKFCIRNNEVEWSRTIFRELLESNPKKDHWDVVLQWAAGAMGKGVEDVERMIQVMIRHNKDDESIRPDIVTINGLVELAMSLKDPYLAERYIALGLKSGIQPDSRTYILQMNYRIDARDLTGAQAAYEALQSEEVLNNEDLPAINKYIRALCAARNDYYDRITSIISDLEERHKKLEADTVSALSLMYLRRGEIYEVDDLLQTQAYHYTADERQRLLNTLVSFCLDRNTSTVRAWDAYCITRDILDELSVKERTILMNEFFARGRSDMACHIFGHMRQHPLPDRRPVLDTYIQCFLGIASLRDREHLDMVHNMLKMDSTVEPNTKLYNSLILAYTECEDADRALEFWEDITNSTEGPSYKSLEIVFRACGRKPFGDKVARRIWNKMRSMEIEVTKEVFASYIAALAGQGKFEEARDMVGVGEKELAIKVDVNL